MKVVVVSHDNELHDMCRSLLRQMSLDAPIVETPGSPHQAADVTIWDLSSGVSTVPMEEFADEARDLFLVSRSSLSEVHRLLPGTAFGLLLKPVRRPVLQVFLATALNRWTLQRHTAGGPPDRDDLLQALLEANIRLQETDHDRTNFLARALHDFRTPLTSLQGYCEMLMRQTFGSPLEAEQLDLLQRMRHSISRISKMSRAMFELSVRNNTERTPNLVRTTIEAPIQNAVHQILPIAEDREITVTWELDPVPPLYIDPAAIEQVMVNLLENSCKFTPRQGSIEIRGTMSTLDRHVLGGTPKDGGIPAYLVEIQDTGMGILPEHLDSVFEEYTSYAGARDRSGGGLGLAMSKMLILEHKGAIWAQSSSQGTTMSFVLPIQQDALPHPVPPRGDREFVEANR